MDQPTNDGVNTYYVSKTAADLGLKVALSGLGSDELFFGYPTFQEIEQYYRYALVLDRLPLSIRRPMAAAVEKIGNRLGSIWPVDHPTDKVTGALRSMSPFGTAYYLSRGLFSHLQRDRLFDSPADPWPERVESTVAETLRTDTVGNAVSHAELSWYMGCQLLRDTDAMSMAHSLEVRVPFLDAPFAETVLSMPTARKAAGEKRLLKDIVGDVVPDLVTERDKTGFVFPIGEWLRDELKPVVDRALADHRVANAGLDPSATATVRRSFERGDRHWSALWSLVVLSLWVDEHIELDS
jgi:asparagine synthase (glutamine-hydrolysing)